jgi:PAS domain S-box-containing protein
MNDNTPEIESLRRRLQEAEEALQAIREGDVDGIVMKTPIGDRVFALEGADRPYRTFVEEMQQGALTLNREGTILYANRRFAEMLERPDAELLGSSIQDYVSEPHRHEIERLLEHEANDRQQTEVNLTRNRTVSFPAVISMIRSTVDQGLIIAVVTDMSEQRRQERLVQAANLARAILDQAADAIVMCDEEGLVLRASRGAIELCRRDPITRPFAQAFPLKGADGELITPQGVLTGETVRTREVVLDLDNGRTRMDLSMSAGPLRNSKQAIIGTIVTLTDITDRKRAEDALQASEHLYRTVGETIPFGVFCADAGGDLTYVAELFLKVLGLSSCAEILHWEMVLAEDREAVRRDWIACIKDGSFWDREFRICDKDGRIRSVLSRAVPIRDDRGSIVSWVGTNLDVTERARMREALKEADRRKDEFLAILSHELRNPLAPILTAVSILKMPGARSEDLALSRDVIERQVQQMVRLVDDLLDVSRITRGRISLHKEVVEIEDVISAAVETASSLIRERKILFEVRPPQEKIRVDADRVRLTQVLGNLLNNAAKYTPPGGRITLEADRRDACIDITVRDTGMGIPPDMLTRVFDLFVQAEFAPGRSGGLGVGLTIVKSIVEMHGGQVQARSEGPGRGSEFVVTLPCLEADLPRAKRSNLDAATASSGKRRILVVDDNVDAAMSCAMLLRIDGHDVQVAHDGPSGLDRAKSFSPEIVLLDIGLPEMDGYEVARQMRSAPETGDAYLVAITGFGQEEDRRKSRQAGFDLHLVKPVTFQDLQSVISGALSIRAR